MGLIATLTINDIQHNNTQHKHLLSALTVIMLSVALLFMLCGVPLCWMSLLHVVAPFIFFDEWSMHYELMLSVAYCNVTRSVVILNVIMQHVVAPFIFFDEWSMHYEPYAECRTSVMLCGVLLCWMSLCRMSWRLSSSLMSGAFIESLPENEHV